ncbi:glycosyltransferase family 2 protein [Billgrantia endophytica]|nr:glycosyltransferase family 2 protein [Halomonas endophytica]
MTRITAVVLTYNRKELLQRCLDAIQAQTRPCDDLLVINNASTDGTREMLESERFSSIKIYSLKKNIGAAGGFNTGFRMAYDNGADQIWMMDDDVIPEPDALEKLLDANALLDEKGVGRSYLVSLAYSNSGRLTNLSQLADRHPSSWPTYLEHGLVAVGFSTFVSILVPRDTLEKYGLPISSMFIWGEDAEFTLRVTREEPGYLVGSSKVAHVRAMEVGIDILAETNPARINYYRCYVRNNIFLARKYKTRRRLLSVLAVNVSLVMKLLVKGEFRKANIVLDGMVESIRFRPVVELVSSGYDYSNIEITAPKSGVWTEDANKLDINRSGMAYQGTRHLS